MADEKSKAIDEKSKTTNEKSEMKGKKSNVSTFPTLQFDQLPERPPSEEEHTNFRSVWVQRELKMLGAIIDGLGRRPNKYERVTIEELKRSGLPSIEVFEQSSDVDQEIYSLFADATQKLNPDLAGYEKAGRLICQQAWKQALESHVKDNFGRDLNAYELAAIEQVPLQDEKFLNDTSAIGVKIYTLLRQVTDTKYPNHPEYSKFEEAGRLIFHQRSIPPPNYEPLPIDDDNDEPPKQSPEKDTKKSTKGQIRCNNCATGHRRCDRKRPSCSLCVRKGQNCVYPVNRGEEGVPASSNQGAHSTSSVRTPQAQQASASQPSSAGSFGSGAVAGSQTGFSAMNAPNATTGFSSGVSGQVTCNGTHHTSNIEEGTTSQGFATSSSRGTCEHNSAPNSIESVRQLKRTRGNYEMSLRGGSGDEKDADSFVNSTPQHVQKENSKRGSLNDGSERRRTNSTEADPDETESDDNYQKGRGRAPRVPPQKGPKAPARRSMRPRVSTVTAELPMPGVQDSPSANATPEKNGNRQKRGWQTRRLKQKGMVGYEEVLVPQRLRLYKLSQSDKMPEVLKAPAELGPMKWVRQGVSSMQVPVSQPSNGVELYGAEWPQHVSKAQVANEEVEEDRINWDYEIGAVMAGAENWNPQPVVHPPPVEDIQRQYEKHRLHECLQDATNGFKVNIFQVDAKKWREAQRERLGEVRFQKIYGEQIERERLERLVNVANAREKVVEASKEGGMVRNETEIRK